MSTSGAASTAARTIAGPPLACTVRKLRPQARHRAGGAGDRRRDVVQLEVEEQPDAGASAHRVDDGGAVAAEQLADRP